MFSDYDSMSSRNSLSSDDFKQYCAELQRLQDICDAFEQTHDEGKFWSLYLRANCLADELANCRSDLTACQSKLEVEKKDNAQMDIGRLHIALVFSSLSVALFIACCPFSSPLFIVVGILASAFVPLVLLWFSYGIVQILYERHTDLYLMFEKKDKQIFAVALAFPVILSVIYRVIGFWSNK